MNFLIKNVSSINRVSILLMLFSFSSTAQTLFNKRIKKLNVSETAYSVLVKGNSFFVFGGEYYNYGTTTNIRYLTMKLDSLADTLYTKSYGKIEHDFYPGYWGGACFLNNSSYDFGTKADSLNHPTNILYKFTAIGDTTFTKVSNDTFNNYGSSVKVARNQSLILLGSFDSINPNYDFSLIHTDTLGNIKFQKHYGTSNPENPCTIDTCKDGGFIMCGWRQTGGFTYVAYVVKTDSLGGLQWQNTYGNNAGVAIFTEKKGGYIITACYQDSLVGADAYTRANLIKIDNSGSVVWDKKYGSSGYGTAAVISYELPNGDIISCGKQWHPNSSGSSFSYGIYGFIMKTDSLGNLKFYQTYQADTFNGAQNYLYDIKPLAGGGFIAVGFVQPNDGTTQDVWVLRVDSNGCEVAGCSSGTGIEHVTDINNQVNIYPNPASNSFRVVWIDNNQKKTVQIYDVNSKIVLTQTMYSKTSG